MGKKVLMFGWEFPPFNSGGLGVACYGLTKSLAKKGLKIIFVLPKKFKGTKASFLKIIHPSSSWEVEYNFNVFFNPYLSITDRKRNTFRGDRGKNLLEEVLLYARFGEFVAKKESFDVIHAHDWLSFGAGVRAKEKSRKPLVVHVHATEFDRCGGCLINQDVYSLEKEGMEKANKIIAVSNFTKNIIIKNYGIPSEKIEVVHNGIDFSENGHVDKDVQRLKKEGKKMVLFVGRITLQKGPDYFVRMAKRVCDIRDDVFFVVSGSGDMEHQIIEEVAQLGISDRVFFTGFLRDNNLKKVYQLADIFVMPSVSEPFGITVLESLINGTPALISKQSGVAEVISHALKVDFWDVEEMVNKILATLNYTSLSSSLAENGQREVKDLTWDCAAEKCIKVYESL